MKSKLLTFVSICLTTSLLHAVTDQSGWEADLKLLQKQLPALHKNLFFKIAQEEFIQDLARLKADLPNLTDEEAYWQLQKIVVAVGDDHTGVSRQNASEDKLLPVAIGVFSDGLYILGAPEANKQAVGARLTAVKDEPIAKVVACLRPFVSVATKATLKHRLPNVINSAALWRAAGLAEPNGNVKLTCITKNQETYTFEAVPLTKEEFKKTGEAAKVSPKPCPTSFRSKSYFFIEKSDDGKILYAQYNKCTGRETVEQIKGKAAAANLPSIVEFFEQLKTELKSTKVEKFIFDLRWNSGGSSVFGTEFITALSKNNAINQRGKLFVLIGRRTFSSALLNACEFKERTNATLIGEPTSGTVAHFGEVKTFPLPHAHITVAYSSNYFQRGNGRMESLVPDIAAEQSFEDFMNGVDPAYQAAVGDKNAGMDTSSP